MIRTELLGLVQRALTDLTIRNYAAPDRRPEDGQLIDALVDLNHQVIQRVLDQTRGGFAMTLARLHRLHHENQFLQDRLQKLERRRLTAHDWQAFLLVQSNAERLDRARGPKRVAPQGIALEGQTDLTCFIDPANIVWQQAGLQVPYRRRVANIDLVFAVNPWPFGKTHTTVIWPDGSPQGWANAQEFREILLAMVSLASELPGYSLLYNGLAGASIPKIRHIHLFELEEAQVPMPCQHAAALGAVELGNRAELQLGPKLYPMPLRRFAGPNLVDDAVRMAEKWHAAAGDATENLMVFTENEPVVYMALRQRSLVKAAHLAGDVAALEAAGEIVLSTESEIHAVLDGAMSYDEVASVLRDVTPWRAFDVLAG
jgi:hypothetical protein